MNEPEEIMRAGRPDPHRERYRMAGRADRCRCVLSLPLIAVPAAVAGSAPVAGAGSVTATKTLPPVAIWELGGPQDRRLTPGGR